MKRIFNYILVLCFVNTTITLSVAQQINRDSLFTIWNNKTKADTIRLDAIDVIIWDYINSDLDTALAYTFKQQQFAKKKNVKKWEAASYNNLCVIFKNKGDYELALKYGDTALSVNKSIKFKKGMSSCLNTMANIYRRQGNLTKSIDFNLKSLKIKEELKDTIGMGHSFGNIANVYTILGEYDKSLYYHFKSLKIRQTKGPKKEIPTSLSNIGNVYFKKSDFKEGLKYQLQAYKLDEEANNLRGMAYDLANVGLNYKALNDLENALASFKKASEINIKTNDKPGIAHTYCNIGSLYIMQKKYSKAILYLEKSLKLVKDLGEIETESEVNFKLYEAYKESGNKSKALEHYEEYTLLKDSVFKTENQKQIIQKQLQYEYDKKTMADSLKVVEEKKVTAAQFEKEKITRYSLFAGIALITLFGGFMYNRFRVTQKQKKIISEQKLLVDEKNLMLNQQNEEISTQRDEIEAQRDEIEAQRDLVTEQKENIEEIYKEVTDSINYAKRIQEAVLPISDSARSVLGEHFVLFKPKDIVSGDFYWTIKINNLLFIAVADCTGHGVPGAFMSMLGISFLNEIVQKQEINKANQILNHLRSEIINALQQKGMQGEQKDGMDISLLVINTDTNETQWAGANNPLYIISSVILNDSEELFSCEAKSVVEIASPLARNDEYRLIEIKGDKMPIAIYPEMKEFTNHELSLNKGDSVYLFTDGIADQFGGPNEKKFKYKPLKEILFQNRQKTMNEQKETLELAFEKWKGNLEQVDDVTILGIRI